MKKVYWALIILCAVVVLSLPAVLYWYKFGFGLWDKHEDWALMGTYFGGFLGPLVTALSVCFLGFQIKEHVKQKEISNQERRASQLEADIHRVLPKFSHFFQNESFISSLKSEIEDYKSCNNERHVVQYKAKEFASDNLKQFQAWALLDSSLRNLYRLDNVRYRAMRQYMIIECELEHMQLIDFISNKMPDVKEKKSCLFL